VHGLCCVRDAAVQRLPLFWAAICEGPEVQDLSICMEPELDRTRKSDLTKHEHFKHEHTHAGLQLSSKEAVCLQRRR